MCVENEIKTVCIEVPDGYEIDQENSTFERIVFKEKHIGESEDVGFPRTWEEFCENYPIKEGKVYITAYGYCVWSHSKKRNPLGFVKTL